MRIYRARRPRPEIDGHPGEADGARGRDRRRRARRTFGSVDGGRRSLFQRDDTCRSTALSDPTRGSSSSRPDGRSATAPCITAPRCSEATTSRAPADAECVGLRRGKQDGLYGRGPTARCGCSSVTSATNPTVSWDRTRSRSFVGCGPRSGSVSCAGSRARRAECVPRADRGTRDRGRCRRGPGRRRRGPSPLRAVALVAAFQAVGADPRLLVIADDAAAPSDRARLANEAGAAASITVELTARDERGRRWSRCSYFGSRTTHSPQDWFWRNLSWKSSKPSSASPGRSGPSRSRLCVRRGCLPCRWSR